MPCEVTFHSPDRIPDSLLTFWRDRQARQDPLKGLTGSAEWFAMMASGGGEVMALRREDGTWYAVWALLFQKARIGPALRGGGSRPVLRVCGGDFVEDGVSRGDLASAFRILMGRHPESAAIVLDHVHAEERLDMLRAACGSGDACFLRLAGVPKPHYRLVLPPTWEAFCQLRSPESLRKIERRERALGRETASEPRLVEIRQVSDMDPHAADVVRMMDNTWQARHLGHRLHLDGMRDVAARGWLRSFLLLAGERPVAFALGYQGGGGFVYEQVGYDQGIARHSPGTILLYRLIRALYETDTPRWVDFGEGEAEYKQLLANDVIQIQSVMLVRRSCLWQAWFLWKALTDAVVRRLKSVLDRTGLKRRWVKWAKGRSD